MRFFAVTVGFFFDGHVSPQIAADLAMLSAMRNSGTREVGLRAHDLSAEAKTERRVGREQESAEVEQVRPAPLKSARWLIDRAVPAAPGQVRDAAGQSSGSA
jgi:hypothetical protein